VAVRYSVHNIVVLGGDLWFFREHKTFTHPSLGGYVGSVCDEEGKEGLFTATRTPEGVLEDRTVYIGA